MALIWVPTLALANNYRTMGKFVQASVAAGVALLLASPSFQKDCPIFKEKDGSEGK